MKQYNHQNKDYKNSIEVVNAIEFMRYECMRYKISQARQAQELNCTPQNISKLYRNRSFSLAQYIIIQNLIAEKRREEIERR